MKHKANLEITGMHCASCSVQIENRLKKMDGIESISVNYANASANVEFDTKKIDLAKIKAEFKELGYEATGSEEMIGGDMDSMDHSKMNHNGEDHSMHAKAEGKAEIKKRLYKIVFSAVVGILMLVMMMILKLDSLTFKYIYLVATLFVMIFSGAEFYKVGIPNFVKHGMATMDTLIALGTLSAFLYSSYVVIFLSEGAIYFETAVFIIALILLGRYLEALAKSRASDAISKLLELGAKEARVLKNKKEVMVPIDQVIVGDIIVVKPREKVPTDGEVVFGSTSVDESIVTGESVPVEKMIGDKVIGASVNQSGAFKFRATNVGSNTMLSQIAKLVKEAQGSKAPIQRIVDKVSLYFVWGVIIVAILTFVVWFFVLGNTFVISLIPAVTVLIIACPCALGLATPMSIIVGTGKGAAEGILIKNAESLEKISKVKTIVFDKTGTITEGKPTVNQVMFDKSSDLGEKKILEFAGSVENSSEHPLALAVVNFVKEKNIMIKDADKFDSERGAGAKAEVLGKEVMVGKLDYLLKNKASIDQKLESDAKALQEKGNTVIYLSVDKTVVAIFSISDNIKKSSKDVIKLLHKKGIESVLLTGDNTSIANKVAKSVGIDKVYAEVSPKEKLEIIKDIKKDLPEEKLVSMVGDGVNDAPALAVADVGLAMGTGTDVAIEAGDVVLVHGDLLKATEAIALSSATNSNIKQNLFWAFFYNTVAIPIAVFGLLNPIIASGAMAFSSISVVLNALRLKKTKLK